MSTNNNKQLIIMVIAGVAIAGLITAGVYLLPNLTGTDVPEYNFNHNTEYTQTRTLGATLRMPAKGMRGRHTPLLNSLPPVLPSISP